MTSKTAKTKPDPAPLVPENPRLNVWQRMLQVWTNVDFLRTVLYAEGPDAVSQTWRFWLVWNSLLSFVGAVVIVFVLALPMVTKWEAEWWPTVPEFEASIENNKFSTTLPQPFVAYEDESFIAVVDTTGEYTEDSLRDYESGLLITEDKMIAREDTGEVRSFNFAEIEADEAPVHFDREMLAHFWLKMRPWLYVLGFVGVFGGMLFWLGLIRLISAAWWALVFWGIGHVAGLPDWTYGRSYLAVLNFYVIPFVFETLLVLVGVGAIMYSTTLVFLLVFGLNFWQFNVHLKAVQNQDKA